MPVDGEYKAPSGKAKKPSFQGKIAFNLDDTIPEMEDDNEDSSNVKYVTNIHTIVGVPATQNEVPQKPPREEPPLGGHMKKDELMEYENDPFWVRVRKVLVVFVVLAWIGMLAAAIILIVLAPRCPPRVNLAWWQSSVIYQVYPRSFLDTNGDGVGDLKGVTQKLDYIQGTLKASAIYMNAIFPSGGHDTGYDITNHTDVDPIFGTMEDFDELIKAMHEKDMSLILDFVPNHTSKKHPWFLSSRQKEGQYEDYYVWHPGVTKENETAHPSNWRSIFGGTAWSWCHHRQEYYLHKFSNEQPDLNIRNPLVQQELMDILRFWMDKGVDGFRIGGFEQLFETENLTKNEAKCPHVVVPKENYKFIEHDYTANQPESFEILTQWRELVDNVSKEDGRERSLMVEFYNDSVTAKLLNYEGKPGAHLPLNFILITMSKNSRAEDVMKDVSHYMDPRNETEFWPNWQTSNHDFSRLATRMEGEQHVSAFNMLLLTLPGTPFSYYGQEIGMHDVNVTAEFQKDKASVTRNRDPERTPMQWNGDDFAGFTEGNSTWLPVADDYKLYNVHAQTAHNAGTTSLEVYQQVSLLRAQPSFQWGTFMAGVTDSVYFYVRQAKGFDGFLVAINFGPGVANVNFVKAAPGDGVVPGMGTVAVHAGQLAGSELGVGKEVHLDNLQLKPSEGVIFTWPPEAVGMEM